MLRKKAITFFLLFTFVLTLSQGVFASALAQTPPTPEERAALEAELANLEAQIAADEARIAELRKAGSSLKGEIASLNAKVDALNLKIKAVTLSLNKLNQDIQTNQKTVTVTQQKIDRNKMAMMDALQQSYESGRVSLVAIFLKNPNLTDFFSDVNDLLAVQEQLTITVNETNKLKDELLDQQEELVAKKSQAVALKALQDQQRQSVVLTKKEKDALLAQTKGKESEFQKLAAEKKAQAAKIRSRIFSLLGGGEMTFEQAYQIALGASKATGVPAAFLLAVLDRESALGKNVGRCSYKTAMAPGPPKSRRDDVTPFLKITAELGIDPEKQMVSCAISQDGAYGGAMGPAQFIPTTWMLYRDRIAELTGANPPSPWNNSHAFMGTALYLKDAMAACKFTGDAQIRCAAARYYAGGNWQRFLYSYGSGTLSRMNKFEDDIALLDSN